MQTIATLGIIVLLLSGCSLIMSGKDVEQHIEMMKQQNPMGCAYVKGSGTPPASRVDGGAAGAWGMEMSVDQMNTCLDKLKEMP